MSGLLETVRGRRSVRTFDGRPLSGADRDRICEYARTITDPFGIPVRFVLLDAEEHGLSSPVLTGEKTYVAGIVEKRPYADAAFGFAFEKLVLYAWSLGIGTTWIGGTMKRDLFEKAAGLSEGEMMPCVSPLGYPAKKRSVRETIMRRGVGADRRLPAEEIFFGGEWGAALPAGEKEEIHGLIEMVRLAPSAVNKQPWRVVCEPGAFHFYEKRDRGFVGERTGDLQKIDVGIALCHFVMGLEERGEEPRVFVRGPGIAVPEGVEYVATVATA